MERKPSIAIVGPGRLGTALALALHDAGYEVSGIVTHASKSSGRNAEHLAQQVDAKVVKTLSAISFDLAWLCVPDSQIANAARTLAIQVEWEGKVALHSSGVLTSDELDALRSRGAAVASVHPLMTFVSRSYPSVAGVSFAIEGDAAAVRAARRVVRQLRGKSYAIAKRDKPAYHAWCTFASPLVTALLATSDEVAALAGVGNRAAARRMTPILLQTIQNYAALGPAAGFSGPFIRGDADTVQAHLKVLRKAPDAKNVYVALARSALKFLPGKNKRDLKKALKA